MLWLALASILGTTFLSQSTASYEERLSQGVRHAEAGNWDQAIEAFQAAAALDPGAEEPHIETARVHLLRSQPEAALEAIDSALARSPGDVSALTLRGAVLASMGMFGEAVLELTVAVERDPENAEARRQLALFALRGGDAATTVSALTPLIENVSRVTSADWALYGAALFQLGQAERAVAPLERSLDADPDQPQALLYLGQSLLALGRAEEAVDIFERGARLPPPYNVRFELGMVEGELQVGREDRAKTLLGSLLERHPNAARGWFLRGVIAANEGHHEQAARDFEFAIERGHQTASTYLNLGVARIASGDRNGARRSLEAALDKDPNLAAAHYYEGVLVFEDGDAREAVTLLEKAAALEPDEPRTYLALAEAYLKMRRLEKAQNAANRAASSSADLAPRALYLRGLVHHEGIEYPLAEADYREAVALGLDDEEVHLNLGRALYAMAKHEEALVAVDDALERAPDDGEAHLLKGKVETELRHYESALAHLKRASELLPEVADVWFRKGIVHSRLRNRPAAIEDWRRALALDPEMIDTYYRLGTALIRDGEIEEGEALLAEFQHRSSAAQREEHQTAKLKTTLRRAIELADGGQDEEALAYFEEAFEIAPLNPLPYLYSAEFRAQRGEAELAEAILLGGLEALPSHLSLHRALLSLYEASNLQAKAEAQRKRIAVLEQRSR